jgi:hypothetical protein
MKKLIFFLVMMVFLFPLVLAGNVTRDFSSNGVDVGNAVTVSLIIEVAPGDTVYAIQEDLPNGSSLRWIGYDANGVNATTESYTISFDSVGSYNFSGNYAFNDVPEAEILGDTLVSVGSPAPPSSGGGGGGGSYVSPAPCRENWTCTGWSGCINNQKTRTCSDINNCSTSVNKSSLSLPCTSDVGGDVEEETPQSESTGKNSKYLIYFLVGTLILLLVVIAIIVRKLIT